MDVSARRAISHPSADRSDRPDIPLFIKNMVDKLDLDVEYGDGLAADRPVSTAMSPGMAGRVYRSTDTGHVDFDYGTGWLTLYPQGAGPSSITDVELADGAVDTAAIQNGAVTVGKLSFDPATQVELDAEATARAAADTSEAAARTAADTAEAATRTANDLATRYMQGGGSELTKRVANALGIYEPGIANQIRAGRVLALTDFTTLLGLSAPVGLYNLSNVNDSSGNGRNLTNKGAVTFDTGIMGAAGEAAVFTGAVGQALYFADTGAGDPFRIGYGSWGCWFRGAKTGAEQVLASKYGFATANDAWLIEVTAGNVVRAVASPGGSNAEAVALGVTNVCDDRWHFGVATYDGATLSVYVDAALEASVGSLSGPIASVAQPFNIGGASANAGTNAFFPYYGRIDEAFVTADVLSLEQIRMLYAAKIAHGYAVEPNRVQLNVRRRRKGGALTAAPFSTQPLHLYDFTGGSLADAGSLNNALTNNNAATVVPGADGAQGNAFRFDYAGPSYLSCTDNGLPAARTARTMGCFFKVSENGLMTLMDYGTGAASDFGLFIGNSNELRGGDQTGGVYAVSADNSVTDGKWHLGVIVYDDAAADGLRLKLYLDAKLAGTNTAQITSTVLVGANAFRIGYRQNGASGYKGNIDTAFVANYAMTGDEIAKLYAQGSLALGASPKEEGAHVEAMDATNLYVILDTLDSQHQIDLLVSA